MAESVKILIEADDKASKVFAQTAKNIDQSIKAVKTTGEQAKKSIELTGTLANALGGTAIGQIAGQFAGITEKLSGFSEVTRLGTAGQVAFKASIFATSVAIGTQLGRTISDQLYPLTDFAERIKRVGEEAKTAFASLASATSKELGFKTQEIELIKDPVGKKQAYNDLLTSMRSEMDTLSKSIAEGEKELADFAKRIDPMSFSKAEQDANAAIQARVDGEKQVYAVLRDQQASIVQQNSDRYQSLELIKQRAAEEAKTEAALSSIQNEIAKLDAEASDSIANLQKAGTFTGPTASVDRIKEEIRLLEERNGLTSIREQASQMVGSDKDLPAAENLLVELELRKKKNELIVEELKLREATKDAEAKQLEKLAADQEKERTRIAQRNEQEEEKRKQSQEQLAKEKLDKDQKLAESLLNPVKNQATEGRLLTRGSGTDPQAAIADNTKKTNEELKAMRQEQKAQWARSEKKEKTMEFTVVA